jgi:hypothetical protein
LFVAFALENGKNWLAFEGWMNGSDLHSLLVHSFLVVHGVDGWDGIGFACILKVELTR